MTKQKTRRTSRTSQKADDVKQKAQTRADVRAAAIRAKALAEVKRKAAAVAKEEADRLLHEHEATRAEHERLHAEHIAQEAEAQRLADLAEAHHIEERGKRSWFQRLLE